jgi:hypothetical protein
MEESFFSVLKIIGISNSTIFIISSSVVIFLYKLRPVSIFSATTLEKKLYIKEKMVLINFFKYLVISVYVFVILFGISLFMVEHLFYNHALYEVVSFILLLTASIIYLYQMIYDDLKKISAKLIIHSRKMTEYQMKYLIFTCFILALIGSFLFMLSDLSHQLDKLDESKNIILIGKIIGSLLFSLIVPLIVYPSLKFSGLNKNQNVTFILKNETWFILYPINKDYILVGNNPKSSMCTRNKAIKREELFENEFNIE